MIEGARGARGRWVEDLLRPLLIAGMMTCLAATLIRGLEWLMPGWDSVYFLLFCFVATLEGILSERVLIRQRMAGWGYFGSRLTELLILLLVLKLLNYVPLGVDQLLVEANLWLEDPFTFVSTLDLFTGLLFLPLWLGAIYVARLASELDVRDARSEPPADKSSAEYYLWLTQPPVVRHRQFALDALGEMFVWGGIAMLVVSAVTFFLVPDTPLAVVPTLLYFALGVALLSQARFSVAHAAWQVQRIPVQAGVARRWLVWAALFLVVVTLAALLLPPEYAMGPLRAILYLVGIVIQIVSTLVLFVPYLLALLLALLFPQAEQPEPPPPLVESLPPAEPRPEAGAAPWLDVLASVLFWTVILSIVGYALYRFLRDRLALVAGAEGGEDTFWGRLLALWRELWRRWLAWRDGVQGALARRRAERAVRVPGTSRLARYFSLGRLAPRELVRYFYVSTARRAADAGQPRQTGQTPYEYQRRLDDRFPDLEPDLGGLTEAFVEARYGAQPVEQAQADAVKPLWQRVRAALRRRAVGRRKGTGASEAGETAEEGPV